MIRAAALAAAGAIGLASAATAIPAQAATPLPLVPAAWGCGPGWHPDAWGRCVPNYGYWAAPRWGWRHSYYYRGDHYRWDRDREREHDHDHDRWR